LLLRAAWIEGDGSDTTMSQMELPSLSNTTHFWRCSAGKKSARAHRRMDSRRRRL